MTTDINFIKRLAASRLRVGVSSDRSVMESSLELPTPSPYTSGELLSHQIDHVKKLLFVLEQRGCVGDTSPPGTGKTYTSSYCVKARKLPVITLCPKSSIETWYKILRSFGVPVVAVTNYDMFRSSHTDTDVKWYDMRKGFTKNATVCPWVTKRKVSTKQTTIDSKSKDSVIFNWKLPYKCMIIIDEGHVAKNSDTQTFAIVEGALRAAKAQGHEMIFLSATPIEKIENLKTILFLLGVTQGPTQIHANKFLKFNVGSKSPTDIHNYFYNININDPSKSTGIFSSMPNAEIPIGITNDVKPVTYPMDEENTRKIVECNMEIIKLREKLKSRDYTNTLGDINAARRIVEQLKVDKAEELCLMGLNGQFPIHDEATNSIIYKKFKKVAIFVNYKSSLRDLHARLSKKSICIDSTVQNLSSYISVLHGEQTVAESSIATESYNTGKTPILISTIMKGGISLSFHPIQPNNDTLVLIFPPTSATTLFQCIGRSFRTNVKSSVVQRILFTEGDKVEESIRSALAIKLEEILNFTTGSSPDFDLYDLVDTSLLHGDSKSAQS